MPTATYGVTLTAGGMAFNKTITRTFDHPNPYEVTLPVGKAGTLSTRTDDNTGEATLSASHGITTGMVVDVYWDGGVRYGMTVGTVDVNDVPLDGGAGDNLPVLTTAVVVTEQVTINTAIDGDSISIIGFCLEVADGATGKAHIDMLSAAPATVEPLSLVGNSPLVFDIAGGAENPFTGDPIVVSKASNGSATVAATLKIISGEDATP